jgi:hypothetical protein
MAFADALRAVNAMKTEGVIEEYAIAGAIRVVLPEYLVALYLQPEARTAKRRERAAMLLEWPGLNRERLDAILGKHGLSF